MVRISKKAGSVSSPIKVKWILSVIVLTALGLTGTIFHSKNHNHASNQAFTMVSAYSAASIQASGKPYIMYGTAWKEDNSANLVAEAIRSGFRFIDTACQPKHYNEPGVGEGIVAAMKELGLERSDLFLQTKFTSIKGQDPKRVPYDKDAEIEEQVLQSIQVSLRNLKTTYIDSLLMHSPMDTIEETMKVWATMESMVDEGIVLKIGISNCYDPEMFLTIYEKARIKPSVLQNRFYRESGFDVELRRFCKNHDILYQSFWTLTANIRALRTSPIAEMAQSKGLTPMTLMYAFMMRLGHIPLSGTTSRAHMLEDVAVSERIQSGEKILTEQDIVEISRILGITDFDQEPKLE